MNLPDEKQAQIVDWLLSGLPYYAVSAMIQKEFAITVGNSVLSRFYKVAVEPALLVRRRRAVETADAIGEDAAKAPGRMDAATVDALKQKAFELAINPQVDPKDVKSIFALVLKARDQELKSDQIALESRRVAILEAQKQAAEAVNDVAERTKLDPETKRQLLDEMEKRLVG